MTVWSELHSTAFVLTIRPGRVEEYKRRHAEIWPEMAEGLKASGIVHYDIHLHEPSRHVYGHMLRTRNPENEPEPPVFAKWRAYMSDVLETEGDGPVRLPLERVFHLTA